MEAERREMERLAERVELQMEDVKAMVSEIWTTMAAIVEAQKKILERIEEAQEEIQKKAGSIEEAQRRREAIEEAEWVEQEDILDEIREAQKEHTAALQTMNEVMKGALMVMKGSCRE